MKAIQSTSMILASMIFLNSCGLNSPQVQSQTEGFKGNLMALGSGIVILATSLVPTPMEKIAEKFGVPVDALLNNQATQDSVMKTLEEQGGTDPAALDRYAFQQAELKKMASRTYWESKYNTTALDDEKDKEEWVTWKENIEFDQNGGLKLVKPNGEVFLTEDVSKRYWSTITYEGKGKREFDFTLSDGTTINIKVEEEVVAKGKITFYEITGLETTITARKEGKEIRRSLFASYDTLQALASRGEDKILLNELVRDQAQEVRELRMNEVTAQLAQDVLTLSGNHTEDKVKDAAQMLGSVLFFASLGLMTLEASIKFKKAIDDKVRMNLFTPAMLPLLNDFQENVLLGGVVSTKHPLIVCLEVILQMPLQKQHKRERKENLKTRQQIDKEIKELQNSNSLPENQAQQSSQEN